MRREKIMADEGALAAASAWLAAEAGGDAATIGGLLDDDFTGVGPLGFVLTRDEWLDRHASGALRYSALRLEEPVVRALGDHAVVVARQAGAGSYRGHALPEALRITIVLRAAAGGWRVAHVHSSFVAGTAGAPPVPGRS
jgi:ketosteroid isomerase-like protein